MSKKQKKSLGKNLIESLEEGLKLLETNKVRISQVKIFKAPKLSPTKIKSIRTSLSMSQEVLAQLIGVTKKSVEAWENGTNNPSGPSLRILEILQNDSRIFERLGVYKYENKKSA